MNTELPTWNGYAVHGDIKELDAIIESAGYLNLDKYDVIGVLSAEGENCVTTGTAPKIDEAFTKAINEQPYSIDKINSILISFRCGNRQPNMAEISMIQSVLSGAKSDIDVIWGITNDDSIGDSFKVILVVSANC